MAKFRKKPIVVEAVRAAHALADAAHEWSGLPPWLSAAYERGDVLFLPNAIDIKTPEGRMRADYDDWVILGVKGEIYPCKPDIFEATYEHVPEAADG
jgi:hypothetical protein